MAMVLDVFASYVQNMLTEMVTEEVHMLLGVGDEIEKMDVKLRDLKNFLADADRRNITDTSVQEWVGQLKRAMYEATDILDLCQLKAMEHAPSTRDLGCFNPLLFCMRNPAHAHDIGTRIKALNSRLGAIKERSATFSFINLGLYEDRNTREHASHSNNPSRETSAEFIRSGVVGEKIQEDTRTLVELMLTEKESNNNIILAAIVGVGGIGKTTLAQKIFDDETLKASFDKMIWLSVNQDFDKVDLLKTIITLAGGNHGGEKALAVLKPILIAALTGKKLLLVMDDVWSHGAWGDVLETPLANALARGSRIVVTTRDERVARGMKAMLPYHHVNRLDEEDGWSLLKKQIVSSEADGSEIDMLKDIGLQLVAKCDGLPLALKVMGGLLCQKGKSPHEWEMVLNDSIWSVSEMPEELNHAVYLSYKDLPSWTKQCFLYYSILPRTVVFPRTAIIGMWISEGFLHGSSVDLEEQGNMYYKDLIMRNLIEPNTKYVDGSVCNMHDVVRSFAQYVARDETLAAHNAETNIVSKLSAREFLRLSLECKASETDGLDWSSLQAQKTLRTLLSVGNINVKSGDSLVHFPCLGTLHIESAHVVALVEYLHQFRHLRYLSLQDTDISSLPDNIGNMKFLQYISLRGSWQFVKLPDSIVKLRQLRYLNFTKTSICGIPRGFFVLTNLRVVFAFPVLEDGDWCSLEELGPLYQLKELGLDRLENVSVPSSVAKAKLGEKVHLTRLQLICTSKLRYGGPIEEEEQQKMEKMFDELCPPPNLDYLSITGYFGQRFPRWFMSSPVVALKSLRVLMIDDLACCTILPDGLCQLPYLEYIQILRAPAIKRVGPEFLQSNHHQSLRPSHVAVAFPRVNTVNLVGLTEWEEWEWEEHVQAFPVLQDLLLKHCKLTSLPPGLSSQAKALHTLSVQYIQGLVYVENFASLVKLVVGALPDLERITNLPSLQKLIIENCPKLKVLEGVPALQTLLLSNEEMETLPKYVGGINPKCLELYCSLALLLSIAAGQSGPEWDKFRHVERVKAYAREGDMLKKWYVLYTANPNNLETNISRSFMSRGTLSCFEDTQRFESVFKMTRKTFDYICSLVKVPSLEDVNSYTFVDGRVLCLEDRVAVALTRLYSSEPSETLGSSIGVDESTLKLVTGRFTAALCKGAMHHIYWPRSSKLEQIKSMFDKNHNMPNCCGVICTTHIPFGPNCDHDKNDCALMQAVIDPKMSFSDIWLADGGSMNRPTIMHDSELFEECEKGSWLNGSKLKVASDGSEVGEYIIGDAGYPLLPWLLTPYQEEGLSDAKEEFNRRHSASTSCALKAIARFEDTWKYLQRETWYLINPETYNDTIYACCILHKIVTDMEDDESMSSVDEGHCEEVRQIANEDAVRARDMLAQYFLTTKSFESGGTLSCFEDTQRFESVFKMTRKTFDYICSLVKVPSLEDVSNYTFVDGRVLCLEDREAVALTRLYSSEPSETLGSSIAVDESTLKLVTDRFTATLCKGAMHHIYWPGSSKLEQIKSMFDKNHNMPNCCGVICTTHIPFGPNCDHDKNDCALMQAVIDPKMSFSDIWLADGGSMNRPTIMHDSELFEECEKGSWLNGSKLKVASDGSEVGEYLIGDAGYPLLPWLLTPYQEEGLSDAKEEFNRRHSASTSCALKAIARFEDTWKYLQRETWSLINPETYNDTIYACCILHKIVTDMEDDEAMPSVDEGHCEEVRQIANEDAVRARDMLAQYFLTTKSFESGGTLSCFEDAQRFESVFKMTRKTFDYICSLVKVPSLEDMNSYTFVDGRVLCLEDRVAVALIRLYSSESSEALGSSIGVNQSTIKLVTDSFIAAVCKGAMHHAQWPDSSKMDNIKSMFGKIHNLHNCCGVVCTVQIPFGQNCNTKKKDSILILVIVDPEMRFMEIWLEWEGSMNWSSDLLIGDLFEECKKGVCLNGSKLKVALDGSEVGEYIIGDAGYPLFPWLLTPYQEEDLSDSKAEFNRRHSAATTCLTKVLARFQDTWKFLQGQTSCPVNQETLAEAIYACCMLHNIVIDMEDDAAMPSFGDLNYCEEVRQLADEDAVKARDMLSQYFWTSMPSASGVALNAENPEVVSSSSANEDKEHEEQTITAEEESQGIMI